jgi:PKHD-type hydroxylase
MGNAKILVLLVEPCVRAGVLTAPECAELTLALESAPELAPARLAGGVDSDIRVCRALWLDDVAETDWLFRRLAELVAEVNRTVYGFRLEDFREGVQILRYDEPVRGHAAGQYDAHIDIGSTGLTMSRKLSVSIQLTPPDAYDGGELAIDVDGKWWIAPRDQGTAILFPSFVRHRVAPVRRGHRHAAVAWIHGPAFS